MKKRTRIAIFAVMAVAIMGLFTGCLSILAATVEAMNLEGSWEGTTTNEVWTFTTEGDDGWSYVQEIKGEEVSSGTWTFDFDSENDMALILVIRQKYPTSIEQECKNYVLDGDTFKFDKNGPTYKRVKKN